MSHSGDSEQAAFDALVVRCRELTERYARARKGPDGERHSTIAFEFGYLFTEARQMLTSDPDSPWGIDAFEAAYESIRTACFSPPGSDDEP